MAESYSGTETRRFDKVSIQSALGGTGAAAPTSKLGDFSKLFDELKALKQRSYTLDLQKLEEAHRQELEAAMKAAEKRVKGVTGPELLKAQAEERRIAESKHARDKELLNAKFQRLDQSLLALGSMLASMGPVREMEIKLAEREAAFRKQEEDLNVQRKVFAREKDELEEERQKLKDAEGKIEERERELLKKLENLDVVQRARELDQVQQDLGEKLKAYSEQEALLEKQREELNKDFDKLGVARADVDRVVEGLEAERAQMEEEKSAMADVVAREMGATFEAFVRDMLKEAAAKPAAAKPAAAPKPAPKAAPKPDLWGDLPP